MKLEQGVDEVIPFLAEKNSELMEKCIDSGNFVIPAGLQIYALTEKITFPYPVKIVEATCTHNHTNRTTIYSIRVTNAVPITLTDEQRIMLIACPEAVKWC